MQLIGVSESPGGLRQPATLRSVNRVGDAAMDVRCGSARRPLSRPVASQTVIGEIKDGLAAQLAAWCRETSAADRLWDFGYETRQ